MQDEVDELMDEVDRIADTTQFNGKGLLDGSASRTVMTNTLSIHAISASMDVPRNDYEITIDAMPEAAKHSLTIRSHLRSVLMGIVWRLRMSTMIPVLERRL